MRAVRCGICCYSGTDSGIRRRPSGTALCRRRRTGDNISGKTVPYMEYGVLFSACACKHCEIPYSGNGLRLVCDIGGGA